MNQMDFLQSYRSRLNHKLIGLMSGTSLDGVDAVLVCIETDENGTTTRITLEDQVSIPYTKEMKELVSRLCVPGTSDINDITLAHSGIAYWNAEAVNMLIKHSNISRTAVDAVCMHGQTVWHAPNPQSFPGPSGVLEVTGTLQLGNPQYVASLTRLPVISDFRSADMAAGGQGAPLAPYIDYLLFHQKGKGVAVQNIGGIGNVTVLPLGGRPKDVFAFDTGPGNMIIDQLVALHTKQQKQFDEGGAIAASGRVCETLLATLLEDSYFAKCPPKSTGREVYGQEFTRQLLQKAAALQLSFEDTVATATAFTARSIVQSYKDFVLPVTALHTVIVSGGGARNKTLLSMIRRYLGEGVEVAVSDDFGIPDQAREAMAFALMGHESLLGRPSNLPAVTGAKEPVVLGTITMQQL
ncbi:MAG: anhydro-N-acetylmuramic acid kinase [Sphaerochaeta sp.]|jgi:anhydro-N-acetylmuramic acid kinase|uniref:anhydro-N-acetylmuramic acid kinase n=1 Tax=unclassified Sphaerochaeta TaxID=2637943 RepID=UPI0025E1CDA1|nr:MULTISPECIES: anhydro-N-acetylmuramic acid kinase [unclassified Sphaerochaeta]MCK9599238.1 anhydro-N-acetylmuramic acid kinase [Sphaerochaeta sp.]MDX9823567.1 anhydro-N-acetylmuramic acid kinase [Sphaerochaeta sp.]